jgi:hypothetical protein
MKRLLFAALALAACSRRAPNAPAEYRPADASFSATLPGGWKVDDAPDETNKASFFGPPSGPAAWTELIRVSLEQRTPEAYRASRSGLPSPLTPAAFGGPRAREFLNDAEVPDPHGGVKKRSSRFVLIPTSKGLFVLEHTWPSGAPAGGDAFEVLLRTFKPKTP